MQKEKLIIVFTVLVEVIGFGIVIPILPFYVTSFGVTPFVVTLLFASFSFFAFLSAPFLGSLSDRIGRRPVLLVSIFSTSVGWFVFASATSVPMLFVGRIIDGAAAGNFTIAQSYLVDIARDDKERATNLGIIGAAFGIGLIVGPLLGGILSNISHEFPFWVAGVLALANAITAYFFLPETHHDRGQHQRLTFNPLRPLYRATQDVTLRPLFLAWLLFALAFVTAQSVFALYSDAAFGFDSFKTGILFTVIGLFVALNQGILLKHFWLKRYSESSLEWGMLIVFGVGLLLMGSGVVWFFYLSLPFYALGQAVLRVVITSQVAGAADPSIKGETLGILSALMSAAMIAGPLIGGALFEIDPHTPFFVGVCFVALAIINKTHRSSAGTVR